MPHFLFGAIATVENPLLLIPRSILMLHLPYLLLPLLLLVASVMRVAPAQALLPAARSFAVVKTADG